MLKRYNLFDQGLYYCAACRVASKRDAFEHFNLMDDFYICPNCGVVLKLKVSNVVYPEALSSEPIEPEQEMVIGAPPKKGKK